MLTGFPNVKFVYIWLAVKLLYIVLIGQNICTHLLIKVFFFLNVPTECCLIYDTLQIPF